MDALFVPLAMVVGASVDQIKVRRSHTLTYSISSHLPSSSYRVYCSHTRWEAYSSGYLSLAQTFDMPSALPSRQYISFQ